MLGYAISMVSIMVVVSAVIWYILYLKRENTRFFTHMPHITSALAVFAILSAILIPTSHAIDVAAAQSVVKGYKEYWNGWETAALKDSVTCKRDGRCVHTFQCDPYSETEYYTDSDGDRRSRTVTKYHTCPYSNQETSYYVDTTLGQFTLAKSLMTGDQFRRGHAIRGGQQGDPQSWTDVKVRTEANNPNPVTKVGKYDNFLLGNSKNVFQHNESNIASLKEANLLPVVSRGVVGLYDAQKVYYTNPSLMNGMSNYPHDVSRINGAFGEELHGDLHVVFVPSELPLSKTDYITALMAYWQSTEFKKDALSKNALVVVFGVKDGVVEWSEARTGMPVGNEGLMHQISQSFEGLPVDEKLLGAPKYDIRTGQTLHSEGVLESILWGENRYERVSMSASDEGDVGSGFKYLKDSIQPSATAMVVTGIITGIVFSGMFLLILVCLGKRELNHINTRSRDYKIGKNF